MTTSVDTRVGRSPSSEPAATGAPVSVVVVTGTYPLVTTTFIDREIRFLRRSGVNARILAIRRPHPDAPLSREQRELMADTTYLLPARAGSVVAAHLRALLRHPVRYVTLLARLVSAHHPDVRARVKTVLHFGEGILAADLLRTAAQDVDEVIAHFLDRAATIALIVSEILEKPYCLSVHAGADVFVRPVLLREKLSGARRVVSCTSKNKEHIASIVGPDLAKTIDVLAHGLDTKDFPVPSGDADAPPIVLSVGQLTRRKGLAHLIAACAELHRRGASFHCRIIGEGPERPELERLIARLALEDVVELLGARSHDEVVREYGQAAIFVLPCVAAPDGDVDGVPNVLGEAMASQVPTVSSDLPAVRELVTDGIDGLLVPAGDEAALVEVMARLLDDPGLRRDLGARGRERVLESFDAETNVQRLMRVLWPDRFPALVESGTR